MAKEVIIKDFDRVGINYLFVPALFLLIDGDYRGMLK